MSEKRHPFFGYRWQQKLKTSEQKRARELSQMLKEKKKSAATVKSRECFLLFWRTQYFFFFLKEALSRQHR